MRPLLPDTSAFVGAIRRTRQRFFDDVLRGRIWLSSVVACELYAGSRSADEARLLDRLVRGAEVGARFIAPSANDWVQVGRLVARRVRMSGSLRVRDHMADALIVVSAARLGAEVVTADHEHLETWAELARRSGMDVLVAPLSGT